MLSMSLWGIISAIVGIIVLIFLLGVLLGMV